MRCVSWLLAITVPLLAVPVGAWLVASRSEASLNAIADVEVMIVQLVLAAAPLLTVAAFGLWRGASRSAICATSLVAAVLTLAVWGFYHFGGFGMVPELAASGAPMMGLILLASPIIIGIIAILTYVSFADADAGAWV